MLLADLGTMKENVRTVDGNSWELWELSEAEAGGVDESGEE